MLTSARLRELLHYNPETGVFKWLVSNSNRVKVGDIAGVNEKNHGYLFIGIDGKVYKGSRLAVLYMTGEWPLGKVDHKNRNPTDDRWKNLRCCTQSQNLANVESWSHNTSGFKGVYFNKQNNKWHARITKNKKTYHIGFFTDKVVAAKAYIKKAKEINGEFAPWS